MITLIPKEPPAVPLEAETLCPDVMATLANDAIRELPVYLGKRRRRIEDFFVVEGEASDQLEIRGDVTNVKWIGRRMTRGRITIAGNAGMHLGAHMQGGTIDVSGSVSDWLGGEMSGGLIRVHGNAGGQIGAAYRGSVSGMTDGTIIVDGTGGLEIGMRMKRGIIAIGGPVRESAGLQMKGGTLVIRNGAEVRTGAWMSRGTIISLTAIQILPTFSYAATYNPTFLRLYARHLGILGFPIPYEDQDGAYERYTATPPCPAGGNF